jgi:hypothetical protein
LVPDETVLEKVTELPWQTCPFVELELIEAVGLVAEFTETDKVLAVPFPHELEGVTEILPEPVPKFTSTEVVPWPEIMDAPEGTTQIYPEAPETAAIE